MPKPLFKWSGGKGRLYRKYSDLNFFPDADQFETFVDLFFGGGAVTLWVAERYPDKKLIINDLNSEMMNMLFQMRDNWSEFRDHYLRVSEVFLNTVGKEKRSALYYCYRKRYCWNYKWMSEAEVAANLLVMMKTNFNGIWKNYKKFGSRYATCPGTCKWTEKQFDIQKVEEFRDVLQRATLFNRSFQDVPIPENSWVYADPPYRAVSDVYATEFTDDQQRMVCNVLKASADRGCLIGLSNKETGDGFWDKEMGMHQIHYVDHKYTCGYGDSGYPVTEVLIKNYNLDITKPITLEDFF